MEQKFDKHAGGAYDKRYVEPQKWFYDTMARQLGRFPTAALVLDVGSGPGSLAKLADESGHRISLLGVEPSDLVQDGEALARELEERQSGVRYAPKRGSIEESQRLHDLKPGSLDGIVLMRSVHEIAISRGRQRFVEDMRKLSSNLKKDGLIVVGDPTYRTDIMRNQTGLYDEEVRVAIEIAEETLGHSHTVNEFIEPHDVIKLLSEDCGCHSVEFFNTLPQYALIEKIREKGLEVERSPVEMYVLTARKSE
ncbi:MAG: class I SAM-dependent methyltransferase [Nanoarchaeota archaeon]